MSVGPPAAHGAGMGTREWRRLAQAERHPSDLVRVILGTALLVAGTVVSRAVSGATLEEHLFRFFNAWPLFLTKPARVITSVALVVPAAAVVAMLALRRRRGAATVVLAVATALGLVWLVAELAGAHQPLLRFSPPTQRGGPLPGHTPPSVAVAVAAATAAALGPFLLRALQRAAWALVILTAFGDAFLGRVFPLDLIGAFLIGWVAGSAARLIVGAPRRALDAGEVLERLAENGLEVNEPVPLAGDARGSVPYLLTGSQGEAFFMKEVTSENRDADLLFKIYRAVAYRGLEDEDPFLSPKRAVEHEAYVGLLAKEAGVRTPHPRLAAAITPQVAVLIQDQIDARGLDTLSGADISSATLTDIWTQVVRLRQARIAHRDLRLGNLMVDGEGRAWIIDFGFAENAASPRRLAQDVSELLASLASVVGVQPALDAAVATVGRDAVGAAVPFLQPPALSRATRAALKTQKGLLDELRTAASAAAGIDEPRLERLQRIRLSRVLEVVVLSASIYLLLPEVFDLWDNRHILADARWELVLLAVVASAGTYVFDAAELQAASIARIGLWETVRARLAASFANRFAPAGLGGAAVTVRYLQRAGSDLTTATATYGLSGLAGAIVPMLVALVCAVLAGRSDPIHLSSHMLAKVLLGVGLLLAAMGLIWFVPALRQRVLPPIVGAFRNLGRVFRSPARALKLFGSQVIVTCLYIAAFVLSCRAFGISNPTPLLAFLYLTGSTVGSASPTPGGLGAVEALLIGALIAVGVGKAEAVAAVLTFRLTTFWLPVPFGAWSLSALRKTGHL